MKQFPNFLLAVVLTMAACSTESSSDQETITDRLNEIEGKELTAGEVVDLVAKADILCQIGDDIAVAMWEKTRDSLKSMMFWDFSIEVRCPERIELYAERTGRLLS